MVHRRLEFARTFQVQGMLVIEALKNPSRRDTTNTFVHVIIGLHVSGKDMVHYAAPETLSMFPICIYSCVDV